MVGSKRRTGFVFFLGGLVLYGVLGLFFCVILFCSGFLVYLDFLFVFFKDFRYRFLFVFMLISRRIRVV